MCGHPRKRYGRIFFIIWVDVEKREKTYKKAFNEKGIKESPGIGFGCP